MAAPHRQRARPRGPALCPFSRARPSPLAWLIPLAAVGGLSGAPRAEEARDLPVEAAGEIPFALDAALLLDEQGAEQVYFVLAVPEEKIECVAGAEGEGDVHRLEIQLDNLGLDGRVGLRRTQPLTVPCDREGLAARDASGPAHRLLYLFAPWVGGEEGFELRLLDLEAVRTGLIYQIESSHRRGAARGRISRPALEEGRGLSGIVFLWDAQEEAFEEGWRGDFLVGSAEAGRAAIDPNPRRAFGLRQQQVRAYIELYGLEDRRIEVRVRVREVATGEIVGELRGDFEAPGARLALVHDFDARPLASGTYELEWTASARGEAGGPWRVSAPFEILWREGFWDQTEAELEAEARLLLTEEEMLRYQQLRPGGREALLDSLWGDIDGLVAGELLAGPTRALFAERMATADARFSRARTRGSFSDRGRVFIRYGEPEEIHKELMPAEQDLIGRFLEREIGEDERADTGGPMRIGLQDDSAYEVWYYMQRGEPLIPEREPPGRGRSLKFVFVDRLGNGDYRLIYSNIMGGID